MSQVRVGIVGASGYTGGELLRLLLSHPGVEVAEVSSERLAGQFIHRAHPHLRKRSELSFKKMAELGSVDVLFCCLPHGESAKHINTLEGLAPRLIDLSADFRLNTPSAYQRWYGYEHPLPQRLIDFVYGIPELHREEMRSSTRISSAGCNATATILGLYPLSKFGLIGAQPAIVDIKAGSSEGGRVSSESSHHPERSHSVRSFSPTGHRHTAEVLQELSLPENSMHLSLTALDMVRGVLATASVFPSRPVTEKELWQMYREVYGKEPFVRIVKDRQGNYRYPEPKLLWGTNYCDVGFEVDPHTGRIVVISAIDNLMKGAAGQAVQAMNLMLGLPETTALEFSGLHPI
jgi:N-acetyl-gamma-glutamyl-phosphate/LysW-gamma-L-alpha-aminoadipyl-6-phosphate reductase